MDCNCDVPTRLPCKVLTSVSNTRTFCNVAVSSTVLSFARFVSVVHLILSFLNLISAKEWLLANCCASFFVSFNFNSVCCSNVIKALFLAMRSVFSCVSSCVNCSFCVANSSKCRIRPPYFTRSVSNCCINECTLYFQTVVLFSCCSSAPSNLAFNSDMPLSAMEIRREASISCTRWRGTVLVVVVLVVVVLVVVVLVLSFFCSSNSCSKLFIWQDISNNWPFVILIWQDKLECCDCWCSKAIFKLCTATCACSA